MKNLFKSLLLLVLFSNALTAEILFDLNAQNFSNALDAKGVAGKYDLPSVYVTTDLKYDNNKYSTYSNNDSSFDIELKEPLNTVMFTYDMQFSFDRELHVLQLIDVDGNIVTMGLSKQGNGFNFDGHESDYPLDGTKRMIIEIRKTGTEFSINLNNGDLERTYTVATFSKLKFIKLDVLKDNYPGDELYSFILGIDN